jgi:cytochrome P450
MSALPERTLLNPVQYWLNFSNPTRLHGWLRDNVGPLAWIRSQGQDHILVLTPEGARQVFGADPAGYLPYFKEGFTGIAGPASLWVLSGPAHRRERQLFAPAVHANHFTRHGSAIRSIARKYFGQWRSGQTVRAFDTTLPLSRDAIMHLVFGEDEPELLAEGRDLLDSLRRTSNPLPIFVVRLQQPWFLPWRRYARAKAEFSAWVRRVLANRRGKDQAGEDVVGYMLAARRPDGMLMSDDEICDELNTILQGGHQTVAAALAWALYELGRHPDVLALLRAELDGRGPEGDPAQIVKLPYLGAVCDEAIRLHSVIAEVPRLLAEPLQLLGYEIPAGFALVISIAAIHHDPDLYPEPDRFRPERFRERTYSSSEFLPFGGAHRRCLGAQLAEYEMRIALAEAVQRWDFEPAGADRDARRDVALGPKRGAPLRVRALL